RRTFPNQVFSGSGGSNNYDNARFAESGWCSARPGSYLLLDLQKEYYITQVSVIGSCTDTNEKCSDQEDDECEPVPSFQSAFTDALMIADRNLSTEDILQGNARNGGKARRKKGKSKEKRLLFSTGSAMKL
ncbi:Hypothetical predicted protein, partial [Paramuricea clavata]